MTIDSHRERVLNNPIVAVVWTSRNLVQRSAYISISSLDIGGERKLFSFERRQKRPFYTLLDRDGGEA